MRWCSWRAAGTSIPGTSPRTSACSSPGCSPTAGCRCRWTPASRCCRASASAAAPSSTTPSVTTCPSVRSSAGTTRTGSTPASTRSAWPTSFELAARVAAGVQPGGEQQAPAGRRHQDGRGIEKLGLDEGKDGVVDANIKDCLGWVTATSAVPTARSSRPSTLLPRAQQQFGDGLRIFSECLAEHIETRGRRARRSSAGWLTVGGCGSPPTPWSSRPAHSPRACCCSAAASAASSPGPASRSTSARRSPPTSRRSSLVRRPSDLPRLPAARRGPAHPRVVVQPGRDAGADDARLVLRPLREHAALLAPGCIGVVVGSQRNGTVKAARGRGMKLTTSQPTPTSG